MATSTTQIQARCTVRYTCVVSQEEMTPAERAGLRVSHGCEQGSGKLGKPPIMVCDDPPVVARPCQVDMSGPRQVLACLTHRFLGRCSRSEPSSLGKCHNQHGALVLIAVRRELHVIHQVNRGVITIMLMLMTCGYLSAALYDKAPHQLRPLRSSYVAKEREVPF